MNQQSLIATLSIIPALVSVFPFLRIRKVILDKGIEQIFFDLTVNGNNDNMFQLMRKHFKMWQLKLFKYTEKEISARLWVFSNNSEILKSYFENQRERNLQRNNESKKISLDKNETLTRNEKSNRMETLLEYFVISFKLYIFLLGFSLLGWLIQSFTNGFSFEHFLYFIGTPAILPALILIMGIMITLLFNQDENVMR